MLAGAAVIVLAGVVVLGNGKDGENSSGASTTPPATSKSTASTTIDDLFSQPPIIPEAKVSTEGWKTCRNEEYGWEVKYPGEWYASTGSREMRTYLPDSTIICNHRFVSFTNEEPNEALTCTASECDGYYSFSIRFFEDRELLGTNTRNATSVASFVPDNKDYRKLTLHNTEAVWITNTYPSRTIDDVWFLRNQDVHWITSTNVNPALMETVLSTFRFLKRASTSATQE